jgi:surface polysaccharide O-acyltransferase-like enzyme
MVMIPFMNLYIKSKKQLPYEKINIGILMSLFIIVLLCTPILDFGKSVGESVACFALGFFVLSSETIQERLVQYRGLLGGAFFVAMIVRIWLYNTGNLSVLWGEIEYRIYLWMGILFLLGFTRKYFNNTNKTLTYLNHSSFSLYYIHQTILICIGFYALKYVSNSWVQMLIIMLGTFVGSLLFYEVCRRFKITSYLFGIKWKNTK